MHSTQRKVLFVMMISVKELHLYYYSYSIS